MNSKNSNRTVGYEKYVMVFFFVIQRTSCILGLYNMDRPDRNKKLTAEQKGYLLALHEDNFSQADIAAKMRVNVINFS